MIRKPGLWRDEKWDVPLLIYDKANQSLSLCLDLLRLQSRKHRLSERISMSRSNIGFDGWEFRPGITVIS